jgi:hypothetical protein
MEPQQQKAPWQIANVYIARHCRDCTYGWTRTGKEGGILTVCLLDREPVPDITSCSRFERHELALKEAG